MGDPHDRPSDDWSHVVAKWTFLGTLVLAVLYIGSVFAFILMR